MNVVFVIILILILILVVIILTNFPASHWQRACRTGAPSPV